MTYEEILEQLVTADLPPDDALRAAVPHADELAPVVYDRLARFCRGVCLLPGDERLLFYGLHILAAARHNELWPRLVELARSEQAGLEDLFRQHADPSIAALMLSVWDNDEAGLLRLIEHADMSETSKWALFDVLARLTFDGRISRKAAAAFLQRYESEALAEDDSLVWWAWESAVTRLGLTALEPALQRVWQKPVYEHSKDREKAESLEMLIRCAAEPGDASVFDEGDIRAIDDPAAALAWIGQRRAAMEEWDRLHGAPHACAHSKENEDNDPARRVRLEPGELDWLERFLISRQVPASTMPLAMLDGFLTAIVIGPSLVRPDEYMPVVWGDEGSAEPEWDGLQQHDTVAELITRHVLAIAERRTAGAEHRPLIDDVDDFYAAENWAEGFMSGMDLRGPDWDPLVDHRRGSEDLLLVLALLDERSELYERPATTAEKSQIIERLPRILQRIAAFWRGSTHAYPATQPIRVQKIGRNDPCPCGSGKKYKRCCALKPPPGLA